MPTPLFGFGLDRQTSLRHHLLFNHFPPVRSEWLPIASAAIDIATAVAENGGDEFGFDDSDLDDLLPNGQGKTVREVMDNLHLWDYVTAELQAQDEAMAAEFEPKAGE
jgi:hypothetical protein